MPVSAEDVRRAVGGLGAVLEPAVHRDWSVRAGDLTWSCRATAEHLADALVCFAAQLVAQPTRGFVPFDVVVKQDATPAGLVSVLQTAGRLLAAAVTVVPPGARAWHPYGTGDRQAFAAMGVVETLVHGHDLAQGLHLPWTPPEDLCSEVLWLFPDRPPAPSGWSCLLWCTGRTALPGLPRRATWRWQSDAPEQPPELRRRPPTHDGGAGPPEGEAVG